MSNHPSKPTGPHSTDYGRIYVVNWTGYMRDPGPTDELRSTGRPVMLCEGDAEVTNNHFGTKHILRPTAYPFTPPWDKVWVTIAEGQVKLLAGGDDGERFLSNGHFAALVDESTYQAAIRLDAHVLPDRATFQDQLDKALTLGFEPVELSVAGPVFGDNPPRRQLGRTCVADVYIRAFLEIGTDRVLVTG